jgi:long-subunit fatty acid transport protein
MDHFTPNADIRCSYAFARRSWIVWMVVVLAGPWVSPAPVHATFIEQMAIDARAIALANTVTADPPGLGSIHYNPAGLSHLPEGKQVSTGLALPIVKIESHYDADPDFEGFFGGYNNDPLDGTEGTNSSGRMYLPVVNQSINFLVAPFLGMSYRAPNSRWSYAIGNYVPFGVGFAHSDAMDPVRYGAKSVYEQHFVYLAPAVSYQVTKTLSMGVAVGVGQTALGVAVDMRAPNDLVALTRVLGDATKDLEIPVVSELTLPPPWFGGGVGPYDQLASMQFDVRDDFSPNYNVGLLWEPKRWFAWGFVYQSPIKVQVTGKYRFDYTEDFQQMVNWLGSSPTLLTVSGMLNLPVGAVPYQTGTVTSEFEWPQRIQTGIKLKPFERLSLLSDVNWANWSVLKEDRFVFDQDIQLLQLVKVLGYTGGNRTLVLNREFKDTWSWSVGLEYQLTDWLTLLMGYERRPSSVSLTHFDNLYCLPDLNSYAAGFSIQLKNHVQIDLGFDYLVGDELVIPNNGSDLLNSTDPFKPVYNPYAGLDYHQQTKTYIGAFKITMPLEVMSKMLDHTLSLLNPFD